MRWHQQQIAVMGDAAAYAVWAGKDLPTETGAGCVGATEELRSALKFASPAAFTLRQRPLTKRRDKRGAPAAGLGIRVNKSAPVGVE